MSLTFLNFEKTFEKCFFYEKNPSIAVGVSGGPDSLALVILLNQWIKKKKGKLIALVVDHRIRKESFSESLQTKKYLFNKGIESKIFSVAKSKVKDGKLNQARINRFEILLNYCNKNNIFHLFLGHHLDDNIETFILRKIAGSNLEGLNSIQFITILGNIQVIRPLLYYKKKEILSFNKKLNIPFIIDPSNQNTKYSRVAIRKYLNLNRKIRKEINKEFVIIRNNYFLYKQMIYQILNLLIIKVSIKKLVLNAKDFINLNSEIRVKILTKGVQYVNNSAFQIRSKKIEDMVTKILKFQNISLKSNKTSIIRINNSIIITKI